MRSQILVGGVLTILLLTLVNTYRQQASTSQSATETVAKSPSIFSAAEDPDQNSSELSTPSVAEPTLESPLSPHGQNTAGRVAILTAEDVDAVINVRSLPSSISEPIAVGTVGDTVIMGRSKISEDGYTWHYVTFEKASTVGWIREDLLDIQPIDPASIADSDRNLPSTPASDVLKQALDEQCGTTKVVEAYFVTQRHTIYVCRVRNKRLYISQETGTEQIITADEVKVLGNDYIVGNGNFEYRLDSSNFAVVRFDDSGKQEDVIREPVIYTERYQQ